MIKKTFYNLPEAKRERVVNAILFDFANSENSKVSINRIIRKANISRGSFYQYFDDKIDLIEVILLNYIDKLVPMILSDIEECSADVFEVYSRMFEHIVSMGVEGENSIIFKNLLINIRSGGTLANEYMRSRFHGFTEIQNLTQKYSRDGFRFKSDDEMAIFQQLLDSALMDTMFKYYVLERDLEQLRKEYQIKLEIIKKGIMLSS